jgi:hypothetical protein
MQTNRQPSSVGAAAGAQAPHVGSGSNYTGDNANWVQAQTKVPIAASNPSPNATKSKTNNFFTQKKTSENLSRAPFDIYLRVLSFRCFLDG